MQRRNFLSGVTAAGALSLGGVPIVAGADSPDGSGADATWTTGEKYGVGTVADHGSDDPSRVWFTLTEGALTGVRFPRIDLLNVRTVDFLVVDGEYTARSFNRSRLDDAEETVEREVEPVEDDALAFRHTISDAAEGRDWTLTVEYATHPDRDAVLADVAFAAADGGSYDVYAVADVSLSNSGMDDIARVRGGGDSRGRGSGRGPANGYYLTGSDTEANDDEAVFLDEDGEPYDVAAAFASRCGFDWATVDVAGGDAVAPLFDAGETETTYERAEGNVVFVGRLGEGARAVRDTVALGFAESADEEAAAGEATGALDRGFEAVRAAYVRSWREYLRGLDVPDAVADADLRRQYDASAMVLKACDSKEYPGAGLASPSVPWGEFVLANDPDDYGYNYVWSRDLYQAFTAMLAMDDPESAVDAVEYVYEYQQDEEGFIPQNTFVDGRTRWGGEQMDNISYPQVMAYQLKERLGLGFDDVAYDYEHVRRGSDYVARNGPYTGQERWEEEAGYSPSTIAAEIAGLACAASLADDEGERADALVWLALADDWAANVEAWTATTERPDDLDGIDDSYNPEAVTEAETPYYFRINDDRDPNDGGDREINNGGPTLDERTIVDAGFLELVRLGIKPWDDEVVGNSLDLVDETIRVDTPHGPAWYRYTEDGYGEQDDDPDDELREGAGWGAQVTADGDPLPDEDGDGVPDPDMSGRGRLWPIFTGERGEYELLAGTTDGDLAPDRLLRTMRGFANDGLMIPEQVWDTEKSTAFGWEFGEGTGAATPLAWSMAQYIRLAHGIDADEPVETPRFVAERYLPDGAPEGPELSVEFSDADGDAEDDGAVTVSGTTDGAAVVVRTSAGTVTEAPSDGAFEVDVAVEDGDAVVVAAATDGDSLDGVGTAVYRETIGDDGDD
ncbi:glycoside hydrolase family 15 protein [Halegenticoccus tardaugens]|uniref:glycoside hydrolase family 15 protein n=1 Tax=Halegenticoccus tardaugens TaxID=2071624 RepID=UPI00100ADB65|nr:glycoside hydrolase family 15 protein [Halegenticoccus tardaugens]